MCLTKIILTIFFTWSFWHRHMIRVYMIYLFISHLCKYSRGFPSYILYVHHFEEAKNLVNYGYWFQGHAHMWFVVLTMNAPLMLKSQKKEKVLNLTTKIKKPIKGLFGIGFVFIWTWVCCGFIHWTMRMKEADGLLNIHREYEDQILTIHIFECMKKYINTRIA